MSDMKYEHHFILNSEKNAVLMATATEAQLANLERKLVVLMRGCTS